MEIAETYLDNDLFCFLSLGRKKYENQCKLFIIKINKKRK